ncbi:MAG TPA: CbiX/SirB N-terminal domain-containing protein [Gemmatimonadaceae bacterium]|nr:CbiX/SirB N-terminal domain-containing protein [Gemmatimonadaceae bacterium]
MKAILLVDHGSRKREANDMLVCMANLVQAMAGPEVIVRHSHMELSEPSIASGFASCVEAGATEVVVFPYMLSPGKHSTGDIPRMVSAVAASYPGVSFSVTAAFGVQEKLGEIILMRAGVEMSPAFAESDPNRCWDPACSEKLCGDACRARQPVNTEAAAAARSS